MLSRQRLLALFLIILGLVGCGRQDSNETAVGDLRKAAQRAKTRGESSVRISAILDDSGLETNLARTLEDTSVLVVVGVRNNAITTHDADWIRTWHVVRIEDLLWSALHQPMGCRSEVSLRPQASVTPPEFLVGITSGVAAVDGITVTLETNETDIRFEPEKRYVILAAQCDSASAGLRYGAYSVVPVADDGTLALNFGTVPPFVEDLKKLRTLEGLRAFLKDRPR